MKTTRDDDYLICKHYYNHIKDINKDYPDFITFQHKENHYFAWVHDGKVILRSEAYPSYEKTVRGIKAIIKNRDIHERYSIDSQHGAHFLVLWGGGNHQKHTGNFDKHNEIGRSCPVKNKEDLYALMGFMGPSFLDKTFGHLGYKGSGNITKTAAAAGTAAAALGSAALASDAKASRSTSTKSAAAKSTTTTAKAAPAATASSGGGFKWWYLLPLLLIPLFMWWKGCGDDGAKKVVPAKTAVTEKAVAPAATMDTKEVDKASVEADRIKAEKANAEMKAAEAARIAREKADAEKARVAAEAAERKAQAKAAREARQMTSGKSSGY